MAYRLLIERKSTFDCWLYNVNYNSYEAAEEMAVFFREVYTDSNISVVMIPDRNIDRELMYYADDELYTTQSQRTLTYVLNNK